MRNRHLQVRVVKDDVQTTVAPPYDQQFEDKANILARHFDTAMKKVAAAVVTYVVVDTIRQVIIAKAGANKF